MNIEDLKFSPSMEIGLPAIDDQHKEYFNRLYAFMKKCRDGVDFEELDSSLQFFQSYAFEHFDSEEYLMKGKNYPAYDEHRNFHEYFSSSLEDLTQRIKTEGGFYEENIAELRKLAFEWFVNHIRQQDVKIAEYLNNMK